MCRRWAWMRAVHLSKGVWWNSPSGALLPQVVRVDYAQDQAQPRSKRSLRFGAHPHETPDLSARPVRLSQFSARHTPSSSLPGRSALAETYSSTSDGQGHRRAAVLQQPLASSRRSEIRVTRPPGCRPGASGFFRRKESIERHHRRDVGCF
jgi:hypothetical protein